MDDVEQTVVGMLLKGDEPLLEVLRSQAAVAHVSNREFTGVGVFTTFSIPSSAPRLMHKSRLVIEDVAAELYGLENPAIFLLWVEDGFLSMLEGCCVDAAWPDETRLMRAYYVHPEQPGSAALVEISERDFEFALADVRGQSTASN